MTSVDNFYKSNLTKLTDLQINNCGIGSLHFKRQNDHKFLNEREEYS